MYNFYSRVIPEEYVRKFEYWLRFKVRKETGAVLRPASTEAGFLCFLRDLIFNCVLSFFNFS